MDLNLSRLRKRPHPLRKLLLVLPTLSFLLLPLASLVFQDLGYAIGFGMFSSIALYFLLHYLLRGGVPCQWK